MSAEGFFQVAVWLATVIFFAGVYFWKQQQLRKDVNGIGTKVAAAAAKHIQEREEEARWRHNVSLAIMRAAPEERQPEVAELLKEN